MISKVKEEIKKKKGRKLHFRYNGSRNQIEEFDGIITEIYNSVFIIKIMNKSEIKSYTYNDILINNLEII